MDPTYIGIYYVIGMIVCVSVFVRECVHVCVYGRVRANAHTCVRVCICVLCAHNNYVGVCPLLIICTVLTLFVTLLFLQNLQWERIRSSTIPVRFVYV